MNINNYFDINYYFFYFLILQLFFLFLLKLYSNLLFDFALINESVPVNAYEKLMCLEVLEMPYLPYELKLCEIDARIDATHRFIDLLKNGILPINEETLYVPLSNIDDIIFSFNRFEVENREIEFNIDKFVKRYVASIKLALIRREEDEEEFKFLNSDAFVTKFRILLQKELEEFKKDIEYVYSNLMNCYKVSSKVKKALSLNKNQENEVYLNAKKFKYNEYYINFINEDLMDRYHKTNKLTPISFMTRKNYLNKEKTSNLER